MAMKNNTKRMLTLAVMMAASPLYAAVSEIEVNHPLTAAQYVTPNGSSLEVNAAIGVVGATQTITTSRGTYTVLAKTDDLDFFSFFAKAGDVVTLDIDNGYGGGQQNVDTTMAVFDESGTMLRTNDDADNVDSGSTSTRDSRIDNFVVPANGIYRVGVASYPRDFQNGGSVDIAQATGGDYSLIVSGVSPAVKQINISVKPGSNEFAPINLKSKGKIPVALLSANGFNAMEVNPASVTFGATGNEASLSKCDTSGQDVNGDGLLDMVCHFENQAAGFKAESQEGIARGKTRSGTAFEGRGVLKVIAAKTKPY